MTKSLHLKPFGKLDKGRLCRFFFDTNIIVAAPADSDDPERTVL